MSLILAIDQSTSATKAVLFDAQGNIWDKASRSHRQIYRRPGWVEHDAEEIWKNVLAAIAEIARRNRRSISQVIGLSLTNQRETVLLFDRQTGRPLHPAIVWQDRRGDAIRERLRRGGGEDFIRRKTGLKMDAYFSGPKIRWLVENKPALAARIKQGEALIGTMDTFLIYRLTDGKVLATDFTNASRTLLFDIGKLRWDETLCGEFRVPRYALPEVRESAALYGRTDVNGLLPGQIPIAGVMGDSQAALFAQRCFNPGEAKATFGTGTSVLLNIGEKFKLPRRGVVTALAWVLNGRPTYAAEGLINFSAATVEWLTHQLGLIRDPAEAEKLAMRVADNGGVYLVPAFAGLGAPYWSPQARAALLGMTAHTCKEHVVRAALEAIAYQIREVLDLMRRTAKREVHRLHADGGATRNEFLMQLTADLTRLELRVAELAESSAWGAAMNGLLARGVYSSLDELRQLPRQQKIFRPRMRPALAERNYAGWKQAVQRVL